MSNEGVDASRRQFLTRATGAVGAVGGVFAAVPFVASLAPSEKAKALGAPVEVDISDLQPGQMKVAVWRGQPMWVIRRTPEMIASLGKVENKLSDAQGAAAQQPSYIKGAERSIKPDVLVLRGVCTHLGCSPKYRPDAPDTAIDKDWQGGFYCPCHGSKFDLSGRVYSGAPAPLNMVVPPHRYASDTVIVIGEDPEGVA